MEVNPIVVCGCSFMTSSQMHYDKLKGLDWPAEMPWHIDELPVWIKEELDNFGYEHYPSFLDLFAKHQKLKLKYLSEPGASNFAIREQINCAIELKPNLVIVGATDPTRVDLADDLLLRKSYYVNQNTERDQKKSYYMLANGLDQLNKANIPYVFLPGPMKNCDWAQYKTVWSSTKEQPWDTMPMRTDIPNHNTLEQHVNFFKTLVTLV
jgi:hypothetical protein